MITSSRATSGPAKRRQLTAVTDARPDPEEDDGRRQDGPDGSMTSDTERPGRREGEDERGREETEQPAGPAHAGRRAGEPVTAAGRRRG